MDEHLTTEKPSHAENIMDQAAADDVSSQIVSQDQRLTEQENLNVMEQPQSVKIMEQNKDIGDGNDMRDRGGVETNTTEHRATEREPTARPRRSAKPSLKSIESRIQTDREKLEKLWEKVLDTISEYEVMPDSPTEIDTAIKCIRSAFHQVQAAWLSYVEFLVLGNTPECKTEKELINNIMDNRKQYVQSLLSDYSKTRKDLLVEMGSLRSNSRASSVSSVAVRAQARAEVAAAMKKVEMQKQRSLAESQSNLLIQQEEMALARRKREEVSRMESLRLEEEAAVAMAKAAAIDRELGMNATMQELDIELPEVSSRQKVEEYIHKQYFNYIQPKNMDPQIDNLSVQEFNTTKPPPHQQQALPPTPQVTQAPQQVLLPTPQVTQAPQQVLPPTPQVTQAPQRVLPPTPQVAQVYEQEFSVNQQSSQVNPLSSDNQQALAFPSLRLSAAEFQPGNQKPSPESSTEFMKPYVDFMARRELIANKIEKFDDNPVNYHTWKASFKNMIKNISISPSEELSLLIEYTTRTSKQLVQRIRNAYIEKPKDGVLQLWKRLDERYGCNAILVKAHLEKLSNFPTIKYRENRKLQELSDLLLELHCAKRDGALPGLRVLDEPIYLKPLIAKLPGDIQGRWQRHAFQYMNKRTVEYPPFAEFVKFMDDISREKNDPNLCLSAPEKEVPRINEQNRPRRTYKTDVPELTGERVQKLDLTHWCLVHKKPHGLNQCRAFRAKPIEERKSLLKKHGICYRCIASGEHMAKNCKIPIKCTECDSDKHLSALHVGKPPEPMEMSKSKVKEMKPTPDGAQARPNNETKPDGEEVKEVIAKCTEVCGRQPGGKSCSKICLANVYVDGRPENKVKAYIVIDDQSNCSLAKSQLFDKLNLDGEAFTYTLQTCAGQSVVEGRRAKCLVIESLDESKSYCLPSVVECNSIPDNKSEIATPLIARAHSHLRHIADKIPELEENVEILLLVGRDIPPLHKVHESRNGRGNVPWAQRLDLGWVIVGEACLDGSHRPSDISTFKTRMLHNGRPSILNRARTSTMFNLAPNLSKMATVRTSTTRRP